MIIKFLKQSLFYIAKFLFFLILIYKIITRGKDEIFDQIKTQYCLNDLLYEYTQNLNQILRFHDYLRNFIMILSSGTLDFSLLIMCYTWIMYGKNWRPVISLTIFLVLRELFNFIFKIRSDEDLLWKYPGFPSLTITYHNRGDYFYCGSIGVYIICILELNDYKRYIIKWISIFGAIIHFLLLITLRSTYTVSLIYGIFIAHYVHIISNKCSGIMNELYDFNPEETNRIKQERSEANIKKIIELEFKKIKEGKGKGKGKILASSSVSSSVVVDNSNSINKADKFENINIDNETDRYRDIDSKFDEISVNSNTKIINAKNSNRSNDVNDIIDDNDGIDISNRSELGCKVEYKAQHSNSENYEVTINFDPDEDVDK